MSRKLMFCIVLGIAVLSLPVYADYSSAVQADNPLVFYEFEDASGADGATAADTMGNINGQYLGIADDVNYVASISLGAGLVGNAATFYGGAGGGDGQAVQIPGGNATGLELQVMSVEFLVKGPLGSNYDRIYQHTDGGSASPAIFGGLGSGEQIGVVGCGTTWYTPYSGTDIFDDQWHHVVVTFDLNVDSNTVESWYVDGAFAASTVQTGQLDYSGLQSWSSPLIGAEGNPGYVYNCFVGTLDEVAIYDYALDETTVAAHYAELVPEPATIALLGLGGLLLRRRKR